MSMNLTDKIFSSVKGAWNILGDKKSFYSDVCQEVDDPYKSDIVKLFGLFLYASDHMEQRCAILETLGHISFVGKNKLGSE